MTIHYRHITWIAFVAVLIAAGTWLGFVLRVARRAAVASCSQCPLSQIMLALHNYHNEYGSFPPAYVADDQGKPMHSWRALILPYCDSQKLFEEYDFSEPWNGPHNSLLLDREPDVFGCVRHNRDKPGWTNIMAITGSGTAFPGTGVTRLADFHDGPENTILIAEIGDHRVPWLAPIDLSMEEAVRDWNGPPGAGIACVPWRRPYVACADRIAAFSLGRDLPASSLKALMTISGGEPINREILLERGLIRKGAWIE